MRKIQNGVTQAAFARLFTVVLLLAACVPVYSQKQGRALADSLLAQLPALKEDTNGVNLLNKTANVFSTIDPDSALHYCTQSLALAERLQWENGKASALNIIGICYMYKSKYAATLEYWERALKIFKQQDNKKGVLKIIGNLGVVYTNQGDYSRAIENYFVALKYAEELGDRNSIAINLGNIGAVYAYLKNYEKALEYDFKALKMFEELGNVINKAIFLGNIGNVYNDMKRYPEALKYELRALGENERIGNSEGIVRDMLNIGLVYMDSHNYEQALTYYLRALVKARDAGLRMTEGKAHSSIGELMVKVVSDSAAKLPQAVFSTRFLKEHQMPLGKKAWIQMAADHIRQGIAIDLETTNLNELQHNYLVLSEAQVLQGDFAAALESKDMYIAIKDSVFSMENNVKIANLETRRELELKDKQILIDQLEVAKKRNERAFFIAGIVVLLVVIAIVIRNIKLAAAKENSENKLSAFQARMNPHFIFNSLNSIQYLVLNKQTEQSIDYLSEFSTLMRQILDTSVRNKVSLKTEIEMLRSYIQLEHLRFDYLQWDIKVDEGLATGSIEIPGMIVQPFVENAILHGLAPKGGDARLTISFERSDNQVTCIVEDNGIGRERSLELNSARRKERESHGINIVTNRLALLNDRKRGLVNKVTYIDKMEDNRPAGTKVIIQIPIL